MASVLWQANLYPWVEREVRQVHRSARAAHVAGQLRVACIDPSHFEFYPSTAGCVGCGELTTGHCSVCLEHDIFYCTLSGARLLGSPLCPECAREGYCLVCLGRVRPHGFRNIVAGVLGTFENGRLALETQEHGVIYPF